MRFATLADDYWQLESAEARHQKYGGKFWIPSEDTRRGLSYGSLAQLLFQLEGENEDGSIEVIVERMWVLITEVQPTYYLGRLVNQPAMVEPEDEFYLHRGSEIPFRPEHVIDIYEWAEEDVADFLRQVELRKWS